MSTLNSLMTTQPASTELSSAQPSLSASSVGSSAAASTEPSIDLSATPSTDLSTEPSIDLSATPSTDLGTAPSIDLSATPSTDLSAAPSTDLSAAASIDLSAAASTDLSAAPSAAQARASQRKQLQLKRQAHATTGAMEQSHALAFGREAVPQPNAQAREKADGFYPYTGPQFTFLKKHFRSVQEQEVIAEDGTVTRIVYKPTTLEEALKLVLVCEALKPNQRGLFLDQLRDYFLAPNGLGPKDHQKTKALLETLAPSHIQALALYRDDPWWQALLHEAHSAWSDPNAAGFSYCELELPLKPKAQHATKLIQALGERRKLWPEALRPLCDDLIKILTLCQPSKLYDFMEYVNGLLKLSSKDLLNELMSLSQRLPQDFSFDGLIHPKELAAAGGEMRKRLQATMSVPKAKKAGKKSSSKKAAAQNPATKAQRKSRLTPQVTPASPQEAPASAEPASAVTPAAHAEAAHMSAAPVSTEVPAAHAAPKSAAPACTEAAAARAKAMAQTEPVNLELEALMEFDEDDASSRADDGALEKASDQPPVESARAKADSSATATVRVEAEVGTPDEAEHRYEVAIDFSGLKAKGVMPQHSGKRAKARALKHTHKRFNKQVRKQRKNNRRR